MRKCRYCRTKDYSNPVHLEEYPTANFCSVYCAVQYRLKERQKDLITPQKPEKEINLKLPF